MKLSLHEAAMFGQVLRSLPDVRLSANVIKKMADNLLAIDKAFPDVGVEHARMFREAGEPKEGDPSWKNFLEAKIKYDQDTKIDVEFKTIRYEELNIGQGQNHNHLPPHAVAALMPMILTDEGQ